MRRIFATAAMGAMLGAAPALAQGSSGVIPPVDASCPAAGGSTIDGTLLQSSADSVTMTVDGGSGPLLAFGAAHLMLPVAPNAKVVGDLRKGATVRVQVFACPNPDRTAVTMVAGAIEVKVQIAATKTQPKTVAGKKSKKRR